jgi:hypothetical protein
MSMYNLSNEVEVEQTEGIPNLPYWKRNGKHSGWALLIIDDESLQVLGSIKENKPLKSVQAKCIQGHCKTVISKYEDVDIISCAHLLLVGDKHKKGPCFERIPELFVEYIENNKLLVLVDYLYDREGEERDAFESYQEKDLLGRAVVAQLIDHWGVDPINIAYYSRFPERIMRAMPKRHLTFVIKKDTEDFVSDFSLRHYILTDWLNLMTKSDSDVCNELVEAISSIWENTSSRRGHDRLPEYYPLKEKFEQVWNSCFTDSACKKSLFWQKEDSGNGIRVSEILSCYTWISYGRLVQLTLFAELMRILIESDKRINGNIEIVYDEDIISKNISLPCAPGLVFVYHLLQFLRNLDDYSGKITFSYCLDIICISFSMDCPQEIYGKLITRDRGDGSAVTALRSLTQCLIPQKLLDLSCVQPNNVKENTGKRGCSWIAPVLEVRAEKKELKLLWDGIVAESH